MHKISVLPTLAWAALLLFVFGGPPEIFASDQAGTITFGLYPYQSARSLYSLYLPIAKRIEEKTGRKVELLSAPDQQAFTEKAHLEVYDLALVSPFCLFKIQSAGYSVVARGEPSFHGAAIVRADSDITSSGQLRGRKVAAIGRYSYGGYLFLRDELAGQGISPERDVEFAFLDKTDSVILGVMNRHYDCGVIRADTLNRPDLAALRDKVRIIAKSPAIPQFPFVVRKSMDPETVRLIREVLTAIAPERQEDNGILASLQIERIVAARDADYEPFRQVLQEAEQ
jgi:phosphonate transport system substrate-binding protein